MRIVLIGFFASDYPIGLANGLARDNDVTLMLSRQNLEVRHPGVDDLATHLHETGIVDPRVSLQLIDYATGRYHRKALMARDIVRAVVAARPDVVHYQSGGDPWIPLSLPWLRRFPVVSTVHDATHHPGDWPPQVALTATNYLVTRLSHQLVVHGRQQAEALRRNYGTPPERVNVLKVGTMHHLGPQETTPAPQEPATVLFFGRLRAYKGIEVLLRSVPLVAERVPGLRVIIAGSGDCPAVPEAAAAHPERYEVDNRFVPTGEVPRLFQRASLVVLPYLDATQSGVVPLAFQFGRPVVCTNVGSIPEVVDDGRTGLLVPPGDERALADAMTRLLLDPELRSRMGEAATEVAKHELSWEAIARETVSVYGRARATALGLPLPQREVSR